MRSKLTGLSPASDPTAERRRQPPQPRRTNMRAIHSIAILGSILLSVVASVVLSGVVRADPPQNRQQTKPRSGLPSNPKKWVCQDSLPATQEEIDEWCESHTDRGLPLPPELRNPPPVSDFANYLDYSNRLKNFLTSQSYKDLGWVSDAHWRLSGPSANPPGGNFSHNYGPHFPLKVYYSPEMVDWLCHGRSGQIPDGAMMVKAMAFYSNPLSGDLETTVAADGCMDLQQTTTTGMPISPILWAPMLKSHNSSYDGWLWMLQQVDLSFLGIPPQFPPPLFDESAFTEAIPMSPMMADPSWYPTGSILEEPAPPNLKVPDVVMLNPLAGFPYCLSCHSTAKSESTFASMDNILGAELRYKAFPIAAMPTPTPTASNFSPFPRPLSQPSGDFLSYFDQIPPVSFDEVWATRMPAESYEQQVTTTPSGPPQFLTAAHCNACHNATPQSALLPKMVYAEDQAARSSRLRNLSPYGEWRVSPMGLAGRDPVFFSQLQGETNNLSQQTTCIENTCLHCHAVMGQRQLAIDTKSQGDEACRDMFPAAPPPQVPFGEPLQRSVLQQWPGSAQSDEQIYGALGRDGVSCTVCHHIADKRLGRENTATGNFITGSPDVLYGPYKNQTIVTKPMQHALDVRPEFARQIGSSELCGSCHDILLPVFDNSGQRVGASYEQSTYLEWLNSERGRPGPKFRSCQNCHMPTRYKGSDLHFKIANSESTDQFPPTTNRLPGRDIKLTRRNRFHRHSLHGLNGFLNEFFQQFPLILGFQQVDWMSEQPSPLDPPAPPFGTNFVMDLPLFTGFESILRMAENQTAELEIGPVRKTRDGRLSTVVTVRNLTGHDLPTGVGFRRMFLQFLVLDKQGTTLWASGRTNELGFILDGLTDQVLDSEQPVRFPDAPIQPHYQLISSGSQVQIYQELVRDSGGALTTSFLRRVHYLKDNRIRPKGFDPQFFARSGSPYIRELAVLHGEEANDPYYVNPRLTGADKIEYRIPLDSATLSRAHHVQVTLYYQSIPPFYLQQRFQDASQGPENRDDIQRLYYLTSHLNLDDAKSEAGEPVLAGWKLQIAEGARQVK
jgi:mono/diheme cytochrome c family protein